MKYPIIKKKKLKIQKIIGPWWLKVLLRNEAPSVNYVISKHTYLLSEMHQSWEFLKLVK